MRVCLIGYGYWGKNLARIFGKDLVGICDYNQSNLDKAKELYDVQYFSTWEELYQSNLEYDTVAIATKADTHFELANKYWFDYFKFDEIITNEVSKFISKFNKKNVLGIHYEISENDTNSS